MSFAFRSRVRRAAWLALFAMAVLAAAPTLSRAMSAWHEQAAPWLVLCMTEPGTLNDDGSGTTLVSSEHCPICSVAANLPALLAAKVPTASADSARTAPLRFLSAPATAHVWRRAQTRGPPFLV